MEKDNNIPETEEEVIKDKKEKKFSKHDKKLQAEIDELNLKIAEIEDKYLRMAAEYDNYRRRSREEKDAIYENAMADTVKELLPIIDNLDRAAGFTEGDKVLEGLNTFLEYDFVAYYIVKQSRKQSADQTASCKFGKL